MLTTHRGKKANHQLPSLEYLEGHKASLHGAGLSTSDSNEVDSLLTRILISVLKELGKAAGIRPQAKLSQV